MSRKKGPRADGPRARRSFTPGQKLELLAGYEQAVTAGEGGAFLRREGLYSSLMSEWRRARDAGLAALGRRARTGDATHVSVSLARTARWLLDQGILPTRSTRRPHAELASPTTRLR
jgi:hypothetical protein